MKAFLLVALGGLLLTMPAAAQEACPEGQTETPEGCSQQAWVDDCPPDMLCAASGDRPAADDENGTYEVTSHANATCNGPMCAAGPIEYGDGDPWDTGIVTCMGGAQPSEDCDPDVQYLGGPGGDAGPPEDDAPPMARGDAQEPHDASAAVHTFVALGIVGAALAARRWA